MLHETLLYLLAIGIFSFVRIQEKYIPFFSFVLTLFVVLVFAFFLMDFRFLAESPYVLGIDSSQGGNIKLDIISSRQNYMLILPFFVNTLIALGNNLIFKYETHKKHMLSLFVFNLISFMMLICGNNFIQFMTFVFVIDIISQLLISDTNAAKRYSIYNIVADMGIFLVLSMLHGKLVNLDVGNIAHYYETGRHRDFIMFVLMFSSFVKFGLFLFQGYWLDLRSAKFHALYFLTYLSTPMAALILFIKFYPILVVSPSFLPLLNTMVVLSMVWGAIGGILNPQIKEKFVYCNMLCVAFLVKLVEAENFIWNEVFSSVLVCLFIFNLCFYYLHFEIDRGHGKNKVGIISVFGGFIAVLICLSMCAGALYTPQNAVWIISFLSLFVLVVSQIFVFYMHKLQLEVHTPSSGLRTFCMMGLSFILLCYVAFLYRQYAFASCFTMSVFLFLYFFSPLKIGDFGKNFYTHVSHVDLFALFYEKCILPPIRHAGVFANIFIDFIFLERTLLPLFLMINKGAAKIYGRVSRFGFLYYFLCSVIGILTVFYFVYKAV